MPTLNQVKNFIQSMAAVQRKLVSRSSGYIKESGLSLPQIQVLFFISEGLTNTIKEIATFLNVTSSAATQMVEGMVKAGWLKRAGDPSDRRIVRVTLTPEGKQKFSKLVQQHMKNISKIMEPLSDKEFDTLISIFKKIS